MVNQIYSLPHISLVESIENRLAKCCWAPLIICTQQTLSQKKNIQKSKQTLCKNHQGLLQIKKFTTQSIQFKCVVLMQLLVYVSCGYGIHEQRLSNVTNHSCQCQVLFKRKMLVMKKNRTQHMHLNQFNKFVNMTNFQTLYKHYTFSNALQRWQTYNRWQTSWQTISKDWHTCTYCELDSRKF